MLNYLLRRGNFAATFVGSVSNTSLDVVEEQKEYNQLVAAWEEFDALGAEEKKAWQEGDKGFKDRLKAWQSRKDAAKKATPAVAFDEPQP
jgi:hypothetical protein